MPVVLWMTGYSGSGKTTIANELKKKIPKSVVLDGDQIRSGLCHDLGFSVDDRFENIKRIAHVAKIIKDNDINVIVPAITPTNKMRNLARNIVNSGFVLVHICCSLEICEERDVKGLYKKARNGEINNFTGIDSPFDEPEADISCCTDEFDCGFCAEKILFELRRGNWL